MDTRTEILNLGEELIRTKGYFSFSYKDIADTLQVKNAAIHYYFPSKAELGVAIIERATETVYKCAKEWASLPEDEQFKKFLHSYFDNHSKGLVCLMGGLSSSYEALPEEMSAKLKEMGDVILAWLTKCLSSGKQNGIFHFEEKPDVKALMLVSNMMASLLLARVLGKKIFSTIHKQVLSAV